MQWSEIKFHMYAACRIDRDGNPVEFLVPFVSPDETTAERYIKAALGASVAVLDLNEWRLALMGDFFPYGAGIVSHEPQPLRRFDEFLTKPEKFVTHEPHPFMHADEFSTKGEKQDEQEDVQVSGEVADAAE